MDKYHNLRTTAYVCQKLGILGGILWILNVMLFFIQYFSEGMRTPNIRLLIEQYGGTLIAAIVPILLLYCAGGVIYILIDIAENTQKPV